MATSDQSLQVPVAERNVRAERLREFWHYFSENNGAVAGLCRSEERRVGKEC